MEPQKIGVIVRANQEQGRWRIGMFWPADDTPIEVTHDELEALEGDPMLSVRRGDAAVIEAELASGDALEVARSQLVSMTVERDDLKTQVRDLARTLEAAQAQIVLLEQADASAPSADSVSLEQLQAIDGVSAKLAAKILEGLTAVTPE